MTRRFAGKLEVRGRRFAGEGSQESRGRVNRGALSLSHKTQRYVRRVRDRA